MCPKIALCFLIFQHYFNFLVSRIKIWVFFFIFLSRATFKMLSGLAAAFSRPEIPSECILNVGKTPTLPLPPLPSLWSYLELNENALWCIFLATSVTLYISKNPAEQFPGLLLTSVLFSTLFFFLSHVLFHKDSFLTMSLHPSTGCSAAWWCSLSSYILSTSHREGKKRCLDTQLPAEHTRRTDGDDQTFWTVPLAP